MITFYKDIRETKKPFYKSVDHALNRIKNGVSKLLIEKIRAEKNKDKRDINKALLPCVLFSGQFRERNINGLIHHSGLMSLDFDECDTLEKKNKLKKDNFIYACWVSPSGNGVKALVKIPKNNHLGSFLALKERFPDLDNACKDVSRVCYESFDPDIYINADSSVFTEQIEITHKSIEVSKPLTDQDKIYERIKIWIDKKGESFTEGNRNNFLCKISSACNRFGITKGDAKFRLMYDYVNGTSGFNIQEFENVLNSVYSNYASQFGTASFEDNEIVETKTKKKIGSEILDISIPAKDIIRLTDVEADMDYRFENGNTDVGKTTFVPELDNIFRFTRGEINLVHGLGNHGKSTMMNYLLLLQTISTDMKVAVFSPENFPCEDYYDDIIETYIGKTVNKGDYQMKRSEYEEGKRFVNDRFFYLYPEDSEPTVDYILERFYESMKKDKTNCFVIDPWNQLYHTIDKREDLYLSEQLAKIKRFATNNKVYLFIVAHPNGRLDTASDGNLQAPYYNQLSGGMMWSNKMDNIIVYHRPEYKTNPTNPLCIFASQKIKKQRFGAKPGHIEMIYKNKGYLINGINHLQTIRNKAPIQKTAFDKGKQTKVMKTDFTNQDPNIKENDLPF